MSFAKRVTMRALCAVALLGLAPFAQAQQVFRVTAIPDESPTELARKAAPLVKYLEGKLGMKVEFTPVNDYAAAVEALVNKKVDLAWFGGFTFVQANARSGGKALPLVQRVEDEKFKSVFITTDPKINNLADLKGKRVSVGAPKSGTELNTRDILKAAGMGYQDFAKVEYLGYAESVELMKNRQLDATILSSGDRKSVV